MKLKGNIVPRYLLGDFIVVRFKTRIKVVVNYERSRTRYSKSRTGMIRRVTVSRYRDGR